LGDQPGRRGYHVHTALPDHQGSPLAAGRRLSRNSLAGKLNPARIAPGPGGIVLAGEMDLEVLLYFFGRTVAFNCFAMRALTTVFAGILMASPVAGFLPMRAFRSSTTGFPIPGL